MKPARIGGVLLTFVVVTAVGWIGLDTWTGRGGRPLPLPWTAVAGTAALACVVIAAGQPVRRWVRGVDERGTARRLDPLVATRTVVLAKAAAYGGAGLAGWYLAQALDLLPDVVGERRTRLLVAGLAVVAAVAVAVAGLLVQRWCRVPPDDDTDPDDAGDEQASHRH